MTDAFDLTLFNQSEQRPRPETGAKLMIVFRSYIQASQHFGAIEHKLIEIFGLQDVESPTLWVEAVAAGIVNPHIYKFALNLSNFARFAPRILQMLQTDASIAKERFVAEGKEVLTAILVEEPGQASKPERLVEAIESVSRLYLVFATLQGLSPESLAIIGCDSGSDKSFDFLGIADAIKAAKGLIIELWDRTVFYRQLRTDQNINVALKSLSVIEEISRMELQGSLPHEDAERLRHYATEGAGQFLNCGIIIPELKAHTSFDLRRLMVPQPKLLTGAPESHAASAAPPSETSGSGASDSEKAAAHASLSLEEERLLNHLLRKARGELPPESDSTAR
jgi:hypothetical protein